MQKFEWRKHAKEYYLPKVQPELIEIPVFKFLALSGNGNPNSQDFAERVAALYALSYAIKMAPKKGITPAGYFDYTVFPLEGVWDISAEAKVSGSWSKEQLVYQLMIRQPDFVTPDLVNQFIAEWREKDKSLLLDEIIYQEITEGLVVQCLHCGSYDNESVTFDKMLDFCSRNDLQRIGHFHREIYLSDARKVDLDNLKTVLRFNVI